MPRTALLLGATGLVGRHTLALLARDDRWDRVVTLSRRPIDAVSERHQPEVLDFDALASAPQRFACDDLFCALGTTMKQAGSREAFRSVDYGYVVDSAMLAAAEGAHQLVLVSAYGANARSRVFYNRIKGETEDAVQQLGFASVGILRPSLLTGDRSESRPGEVWGERILNLLTPLLRGPLRALRPTPARSVARALVELAARAAPGVTVLDPVEIRRLGRDA